MPRRQNASAEQNHSTSMLYTPMVQFPAQANNSYSRRYNNIRDSKSVARKKHETSRSTPVSVKPSRKSVATGLGVAAAGISLVAGINMYSRKTRKLVLQSSPASPASAASGGHLQKNTSPLVLSLQFENIPTQPMDRAFEMFTGLSVVHYGGGEFFLPAQTLLQRKVLTPLINDQQRQTIIQRTNAALISYPVDDPHVKLPAVLQWDRAVWEQEILISQPPDLGANSQTANLFYIAWLWHQKADGPKHGTSFPLIGLLDLSGGIEYVPINTFGSIGDGPFLEPDVFKPCEQHFHEIKKWASLTKEQYLEVLQEKGDSKEIATKTANQEEFIGDYFGFGTDMARVKLTVSTEVSSATVVCVDVRDSSLPKILVTKWVLLTTESAATKFIGSFTTKYNIGPYEATTSATLQVTLRDINMLLLEQNNNSKQNLIDG